MKNLTKFILILIIVIAGALGLIFISNPTVDLYIDGENITCTIDRPFSEELNEEIKDISEYKDKKYELEKEKQNLSTDMEDEKNVLDLLRKVKVEKEKNTISREKIKILDNEIDGYSEMQNGKRKEIGRLLYERN